MEDRDLRDLAILSELGYSLWSEAGQAQAAIRDTVSAASLIEADPAALSEKAVRALLELAEKKGMFARSSVARAGASSVLASFQYLFPEERFLLLALHSGKWSYSRIARVLDESEDTLQALAWNARVHLASDPTAAKSISYPAGPKQVSSSCPEYDSRKPWTQKLLDEEYAGQQKLFLQDHLRQCGSCRGAFLRAKDVFYRVDAMVKLIKQEASSREGLPDLTFQLDRWIQQGQKLRQGVQPSLAKGLVRFLWSWEFLVVAGLWIGWFLWNRAGRS
jgi:hypothetical protein